MPDAPVEKVLEGVHATLRQLAQALDRNKVLEITNLDKVFASGDEENIILAGLNLLIWHGERVGLIKFGSRVDITFGPEWQLEVQEGQRVSAGSSIIARRKKS